MNDLMMQMLFQNAMHSLYSGHVLPADRDLLSRTPLPETIIEPFSSRDSDPIQIMKMTYTALVTWIDEAKKANYFSKHFVRLSKLILNGVVTMGRGLVSLHNRGEDLSLAPMSIDDLIGVASYHFRKSYLGVIQTVRSHPEVSERLLLNQLNWSSALLRLYRTRDRLNEKPAVSRTELADASGNPAAAHDLPAPDGKPAEAKAGCLSANPLPDAAALFEPAAFSAPRALSALDGSKAPLGKSHSGKSLKPADEASVPKNLKAGDPECKKIKSDTPAGTEKKEAEDNQSHESAGKTESETLKSESGKPAETVERDAGEKEDSKERPGTAEKERSSARTDPCGTASVPSEPPRYLSMLKALRDREWSGGDGGASFGWDDIRRLLSDPEFIRDHPSRAEKLRGYLGSVDSS